MDDTTRASASATATATRDVTVTRVIDAPPERVWQAWTTPRDFSRWFGTPPFDTPVQGVHLDVRPGGAWTATQVSNTVDEETRLHFYGHYLEVDEPRRLVFTLENPEDPKDRNVETVTVTLQPRGDATEMTLHQEGHLPAEQYPLLAEGYSRFFGRMEEHLSGR